MAALAPAAEVQQTQASSVQGRGTSARFEEWHDHAKRLRHRKRSGANVADAQTGDAAAYASRLGAPRWFNGAVTRAVNAALDPALNAHFTPLYNMTARIINHAALKSPHGRLEALRNGQGDLPGANFPVTTQEFRSMSTPGSDHTQKNARLSYLLKFYGVTDPNTRAVFPAVPEPITADAAGDEELMRKAGLLKRAIT